MTRGGKRDGAGRPPSEEAKKMMRVPASAVVEIREYLANRPKPVGQPTRYTLPPGVEVWKANPAPAPLALPLASHTVQAGFPSPADDYIERDLDLNTFLVDEPVSTFFYRVAGFSMVDVGIFPGDVLGVSRAKQAVNGDIVIAIIDNELTVKILEMTDTRTALVAANKNFRPIVLREGQELQVWGVVTSVARKIKRG